MGVVDTALVAAAFLLVVFQMQSTSGSVERSPANISMSPSSGVWNETAAGPGDIATGELRIASGGSGAALYSLHAENSDALLAAGLVLRITLKADGCDPALNRDGTRLQLVDDTELYHGALSDGHTPQRPLAPLEAEDLCFSVNLPTGADVSLAGRSNETTLLLAAEPEGGH